MAREITKVYEECVNGTAQELLAHFAAKEPKGEMVLMVSPPPEDIKTAGLDIEGLLKEQMRKESLKTAVKNVVEAYGLNKNEVYNLALKLKNE